jgi:hypothetical protein
MTAAPGVLALQRAMVWLTGASIAIVFIEPSPYELATLAATVIFFATGMRMRLVFMPLLLLLFLVNLGYSISAGRGVRPARCPELGRDLLVHGGHGHLLRDGDLEDTAARLDMLRRGLVVGAVIAALAASRVISTRSPAGVTC